MPSVKPLVAQWRRIILALAVLFLVISLVLVHLSMSRDIIKLTVTLNDEAIGQAVNDTVTDITSVAGKATSKATSAAARVQSAAEEGIDDLTAKIGILFLAAPSASAPALEPRLVERGLLDSLQDGVNSTMTIHLRPHTTIDLGELDDIPILGPVLSFAVNLAIQISPLGLLFLLHILTLVFAYFYLVRLAFRLLGASAAPETKKKSLVMKILTSLPCLKAQLLLFRILAAVVPLLIIGGLLALVFLAAHVDSKIWNAVAGEDYSSFLDLVTLDFSKGYAVGAMRAAMVLAFVAVGLDLAEQLASWAASFRKPKPAPKEEMRMQDRLKASIAQPVAVYFPGGHAQKW